MEGKTISKFVFKEIKEGEKSHSSEFIKKRWLSCKMLTWAVNNNNNNNNNNSVNNKMLEYDWLFTGFIYGLIGCFRSKLSNLTCLITKICNWTSQIVKLSSQ